MAEVTYKRKPNPVNTYNIKLSSLQALEANELHALCREMGIPFLLSAAPRLITARLEKGEGHSPICDSLLRKPILQMPLPVNIEALAIVTSVVAKIAKEKGIEPDEVNIPRAIPDSYGFYEVADPACGDCPYSEHCEYWTQQHRPTCYRVFYNSQSAACKLCLYGPWCGTDLER